MDLGEILRHVVQHQASDLHLAVGLPPVMRIDGHLHPIEGYPELSANESRELIYSILSQDQRQKLETDWEVDLSYSLYGQARFRGFFGKYQVKATSGNTTRQLEFDHSRTGPKTHRLTF